MPTVLVTGGAGFVGSWVTRKLMEQGVKAVIYSRHLDTILLKDIADKLTFVAGDVLDLPRLVQTMKDYQVERVIHMSTMLTNPLEANPFMGYRVNVDGAINVLEASRLMGVKRVVYISTKSVYDIARGEYGAPTFKPIDEDYPKVPVSIYGATKFFMENMCASYHRIYGLDYVAVRFATTYGPGKQTRHSFPLTSKIIEGAMLGKPLKVSQDIDQKNDLIYTKDMANGIVLACFVENPKHRVFHFGTGEGETFRHLIELSKKLIGEFPVEVSPPAPKAAISDNFCVFNIDRARQELGYTPQYDLEKGIKDYVATMKKLDIKPV
ncbi:MAG: NAD(P)-dependent oxidoreductase [Chloroflexota bacterium]